MSGADSYLDVAVDSGLLILTLLRGDAGNPLNRELLESFKSAMEDGAEDDEIRVVLVRSKGRDFCAGMDFATLVSSQDIPGSIHTSVQLYSDVLHSMYTYPKPVISCVNGAVRAGGVGLVCASDMVFAVPEAEFALTEVLFGLLPYNVLPYLLGMRVSPQKARYLVLSAKAIDAREAASIGIVDEVVEPGEMNGRLRSTIRQIVRSSPAALTAAKRYTGDMLLSDFGAARSEAVQALEKTLANPEVIRAIRAFQEGSTPSWFAKFKPQVPLFTDDQERNE